MSSLGRTFALLGVAVTLAACGGKRTETMVAPGPVTTPEGTVAVTVSRIESNCSQENSCAGVEAIRTLLFTGVPGTTIRRAMVADEAKAMKDHAAFFKQLFTEGGHARYVTGVTRETVAGSAPQNTRVWTVVVNYEALRIALEKQGVIRKFGY